MMERIVATVVLGYVLGSVPFSLIAGRFLRGIDLRQHGSGNLGAANTFRTLGPFPGVAVLLLDGSKGAASALVGSLLWRPGVVVGQVELMLLGGLAAVCGHLWTAFASFRGGKGVATAAGVFAAMAPVPFAIALGIWAAVVAVWRYVSLGSVVAAVALPLAILAAGRKQVEGWSSLLLVSMGVAALVVFRHRENLKRILSGSERQLNFRGGEESE
ncbi:MAG: glycerol-3-phosphate 1-O-acyltransferase PlsY [Candidatus Eiseniibacteriota bacterium]|nr:MAG: glycerol-3-phosphate 1-O-acyltransferase PlsY [Candidatus Eisenbacteria bacterium]